MVGFLVVLLVPPTVGLVTYAILQLFWNRSALAIGPPRQRKPNSSSIFVGAEKRLRTVRRNIAETLGEWDWRRNSNSSSIFVGAEKRLRTMRRNIAETLAEWDRRRRSKSSGIFVGAEKRLRVIRRNIAEGFAEWGRRRKSNSSGIFVRAEKRLWIMRCNIAEGLGKWDGLSLSSRYSTILLLVLGVICGFVFVWYLPRY
jgi:hypothetical protein